MKPNIITSLNKPKNLLFLIVAIIIVEMLLLNYASQIKPAPEEEPEMVATTVEEPTPEKPEETAPPPAPILDRDSICLDSALKYALKVAQNSLATHSKLEEYYPVMSADSSREVIVMMRMGHLFSKWQQHLVVLRRRGIDIRLDIFEQKNGQFKGILTGEDDFMVYVNDTILDANGDGAKDFILINHPASGCGFCYVHSVFLYQPAQHTFVPKHDFLNPTFYPTEGVIRGVAYRPRTDFEFPLYKFRWNGLKVDSVEYIYHDHEVNGQFIKVKHTRNKATKKDSIILKTLPREYRNIEDLDVFIH